MIVSIALPSASNGVSISVALRRRAERVIATPSATKNTTSGSIAVSAAAAITLSATSDSMNAPSPCTGCAGCSAASAAAARPRIGNASSSAGIAKAVGTACRCASTAKGACALPSEFLNRVDEIVLFHRLRREQMGAIVDIQAKRLDKLLEERKIRLEITPEARDFLAEKGYDPAYGARPLKRVMQKLLQDPLAGRILAGTVKDGDVVKVERGAGELLFDTRAGAVEEAA